MPVQRPGPELEPKTELAAFRVKVVPDVQTQKVAARIPTFTTLPLLLNWALIVTADK